MITKDDAGLIVEFGDGDIVTGELETNDNTTGLGLLCGGCDEFVILKFSKIESIERFIENLNNLKDDYRITQRSKK